MNPNTNTYVARTHKNAVPHVKVCVKYDSTRYSRPCQEQWAIAANPHAGSCSCSCRTRALNAWHRSRFTTWCTPGGHSARHKASYTMAPYPLDIIVNTPAVGRLPNLPGRDDCSHTCSCYHRPSSTNSRLRHTAYCLKPACAWLRKVQHPSAKSGMKRTASRPPNGMRVKHRPPSVPGDVFRIQCTGHQLPGACLSMHAHAVAPN